MQSILRVFVPALVFITMAATPLPALDFSLHRPQPGSVAQAAKPYFLDGTSKIFIEIPSDWQVSDSPQALDCLPPRASCHVRVEQAGSTPWAFDPPGKVLLHKRAQLAVPEGAKNVQTLPDQADLVGLTGWTSLEVAQAYEFFGQKMHRGMIFLNLPEHRVWLVTITAPEDDFVAIQEQTRLMLYGLFEPNKMLSPTALQRYNDGIQD